MKKNTGVYSAATGICAAFAFLMAILPIVLIAGCPMGSKNASGNSDDDLPPVSEYKLGSSMTIRSQVFVSDPAGAASFSFAGNRSVVPMVFMGKLFDLGGTGGIKSGRLSFDIGKPDYAWKNIMNLFDGYAASYEGFSVSPQDAYGAVIRGFKTSGGGFDGWLSREEQSGDGKISTLEEVYYVYVDKKVKVTGRGKSFTGNDGSISATQSINISLEAGWNVLCTKSVSVFEDDRLLSQTVSLSADDPASVKWSIFELPVP